MVVIREIDVKVIREAVRDLCIDANCHLGADVTSKIREMTGREESPVAREILEQIIENAEIADNEEIPMCQDTGFAVIFIDVGQEVQIVNGDMMEEINNGVRDGYSEGFLRKSMVDDPFRRQNTGDNTPAVVHINITAGDKVKITIAPKGGGSENMSALKMLKPAEGLAGAKKFIIETVEKAGPNPCPPVVVGVGIGGTMEKAAIMAKHALTRSIGQMNEDPETASLEKEVLAAVNNLGIGPQGLGGRTTALAVHIEKFATHIACLPVAVNIGCHAYRHKTIVI